ncbi:hypothetical protein HOY82DRAFT_605117 [Tuber indicum]|nr:hypothetical protein HOY82DRAFT_605117 [Tuber indicum]
MSSHYHEPISGSPRPLSGCVPTYMSMDISPVSTTCSRDCSGSVQGNNSTGITTPKKESPPIPRFRGMEGFSTSTGHGLSRPPASPPSSTLVFEKVGTFQTVIHQHSPPGRFSIRSEVAFPGSVPNPPPTAPHSTPLRSSKWGSQLVRGSSGSTGSRSPVGIIQGDSHNLARPPSHIEISIPPPIVDDKPIYIQRHPYRKLDSSIISPLRATVYIPGEGDKDGLLPDSEEEH